MTHIVFNEADVKVLESAIELDEQLNGRVICIHDDYAVGPIDNIYEPSGIEARKAWWQMVCEGGDFEQKSSDALKDDNATVESIIKELQENDDAQIWIWAAQNKHDVSGYYWLLPFLKPFLQLIFYLFYLFFHVLIQLIHVFFHLNHVCY
jgi:rRNA maturation endonuclease Nob1